MSNLVFCCFFPPGGQLFIFLPLKSMSHPNQLAIVLVSARAETAAATTLPVTRTPLNFSRG